MKRFKATICLYSGALVECYLHAWSFSDACRVMRDMLRNGESLTIEEIKCRT